MIGKIIEPRGERVQGLIYYLYGPGRASEHTFPHLVAGWRHPAELEPPLRPDGGRDFRRLNGLLAQPHAALGRWGFARPVWHCVASAAPGDRVLSDDEWAQVAGEIMDRTGLSPYGQEDDGVRWVAIRHAAGHIHIVAMLARQDGRRPRLSYERYRVRAACREAGVLVRTRLSTRNPGEVTGYAVALPAGTTAAGAPVWYGGGKLAADLTLPKLRHRWHGAHPVPGGPFTAAERNAIWEHAARTAAEAARQVRHLAGTDPAGAADAAWAAADTLHVAAGALGSRVIRQAADAYDRAARAPYGRIPRRSPAGNSLRATARLLSAAAFVTGDPALGATALIVRLAALAALAEAVADLRQAQRRAAACQQARAAWAPAHDPRWLAQAGFIQAARAWGAAAPFAADDPLAASAVRKCEDRLRTLHPYGMARYDRLRRGSRADRGDVGGGAVVHPPPRRAAGGVAACAGGFGRVVGQQAGPGWCRAAGWSACWGAGRCR